jgi:hypothetical protein
MTIYRLVTTLLASLACASVASAVVTPLKGVASISVGNDFACAATQLGEVFCWGKNDVGQLGVATPHIYDGGYHTALNPVKVAGLSGVVSVASSTAHTCAVRSDGEVWCWGSNGSGQSGQSGTNNQLVPAKVNGLPLASSVYTQGVTSCAITRAAELWCWGNSPYYLFGIPAVGAPVVSLETPERIAGLSGVSSMAMSNRFACAFDVSGQVYCWGNSDPGGIGHNDASNDPRTPQRVTNMDDAIAIAVDSAAACAVRRSGALACWGAVPYVYAGGSRHTFYPVPVAVDIGQRLKSIWVVGEGFCALATSGTLHCWGDGQERFGAGKYPYGSESPADGAISPLLVLPVSTMAAGRNNSCVVTQDSAVSCWGGSYGGGIGRILYSGSYVPLPVLLTGKYGAVSAWIDADDYSLLPDGPLRLSRQDEIVVGIGFDSNSLRPTEAPSGTVDVLDGSTVLCANVRFSSRDRSYEYSRQGGTPFYYTAKCVLPANNRSLGVFRLTARFSGDTTFSASSTETNDVELVDGPARFRRMVEFQHTGLDYFFTTSRTSEIELLDSLSSQGWRRTGLHFRVFAEASKAPAAARLPVRRFYFDQVARNGGRGSHFYATAQKDVDALHALNPQNRAAPRLPVDEGIDSYAWAAPATPETCGYLGWGLTVFRHFRTTADDPNHRYIADPATMKSLSPSTWKNEGVAFCALP